MNLKSLIDHLRVRRGPQLELIQPNQHPRAAELQALTAAIKELDIRIEALDTKSKNLKGRRTELVFRMLTAQANLDRQIQRNTAA